MPASDSSETLLEKLNPAQREAVLHKDGPLLIFAGAGSGKTRVLTHRVSYLISHHNVNPRSILAVTFTNKAAKEMKERIVDLVGDDSRSMWIGTFHSTCARLLRESGELIGIPRGFQIYDDSDQVSIIKECLNELKLDDKRFAPRAVLSHISKAKDKLVTPEDFHNHFTGYFEDIVQRVYTLYRNKLKRNLALDFDDLLMMSVRLLEQRPEALEKYQNRLHYLLIDEYQDVNFSQYKLMSLLANKRRNICVVGDDDQSIYMFRGADVSLILQFEKDYPDAKIIKLEQNYRSTKNILAAAHSVVSQNVGRADKQLWTENEHGGKLVLREADNEQEEAVWVMQQIRELTTFGKHNSGDIAILYRTNAQSRAFEEVFVNFQTRYKIVGGLRFYDRKEVKDALAYLRVVNNPQDTVSLKRIINVPTRGIGAGSIAALEKLALDKGTSLWEEIQEVHSSSSIQQRIRTSIASFARMIEELREMKDNIGVTELAENILSRSGYLEDLEEDRSMEAQTRAENVRELLTVTTRFEMESEERSLSAFLENVALVSDLDGLDPSQQAVTLMTLHSAKGLEFPIVFLVGMEEGVFPHSRSLDQDNQLEEERRLCYVGITRAREKLFLSHAYRRTLYGGISNNAPSRFLKEIPSELFQDGMKPVAAKLHRH
ncbi:MAG: DNA helicase PcrA, partial [Chthonomonadales bacterium]